MTNVTGNCQKVLIRSPVNSNHLGRTLIHKADSRFVHKLIGNFGKITDRMYCAVRIGNQGNLGNFVTRQLFVLTSQTHFLGGGAQLPTRQFNILSTNQISHVTQRQTELPQRRLGYFHIDLVVALADNISLRYRW